MRLAVLGELLDAAELRRARLSVQLLIERRLGLYLTVDGVVLFSVLVGVLAGENPQGFYLAVLLPFLLIGVPALSDAVALERRAGSLDLTLSSPGGNFYFERRFATFGAVMVAQGWLILVALRVTLAPFTLLPAMMQTVPSCAVVAAAVLFWAVRLRGPGAVTFATGLTILALSPWFFSPPIHRSRMSMENLLEWSRANLVMGAAAVVLYLYARRRLIRPETLLS